MDFFASTWQGDALSTILALALLAMSVASWAVIFYKAWLLHRVHVDVVNGKAAFWQARDLQKGLQALAGLERHAVLLPLAQASQQHMSGTLAAQGDVLAQRTRLLRDALHGVLHHLQSGQVLLATVGSTAPFVGAALSIAMLGEPTSFAFWLATGLMAAGVWLHLTERHIHEHQHTALNHGHKHRHDEHHQHSHDFEWDGVEPHSHAHQHTEIQHSHGHFPDIHHRHAHR